MTTSSAPPAPSTPITLAVVNARVWTGDRRRPWADAVAVRGDRLAAVGSSAEVRKLAGAGARVVDAKGQMLVPGFTDAHAHFIECGLRLASVRDATGEGTGVFEDDAMMDRALDAAMTYAAAHGVTAVHHMGTWNDLAAFDRTHDAGRLRTRIYAVVPLGSWERLRDAVATRGHGDAWLRIGGVQAFADAPTDRGLPTTPPESLYAWTQSADAAGLQVIVQAFGDSAVRSQLDLFERVAREHGARDRRFRIEHARHVAPADIPRFAQLGVIASMPPYHAIDDGRWADGVGGAEHARDAYPFRSLLDARAPLAFGSDGFAAPPTPLDGIYAAVTRRTLNDRHPGSSVPEQRLTVEQALRAYTAGSAYAGFDDRERGTLERGRLADFVLVDRDLTRIPPETIRDAHVVMTVIGGQLVYEQKVPSASAVALPR